MEDTSTKEGGTDNMNDTGVRENTEGDKIPFEFLSGYDNTILNIQTARKNVTSPNL